MGDYAIKSVAFGGFDKQDVVSYIEKITKENTEREQILQKENKALRETVGALQSKLEGLEEELERLRCQIPEMEESQRKLQAELAEKTSTQECVDRMQASVVTLQEENDKLRPDAEAFAQFRERIGIIECEARKRADDLELSANLQVRQMIGTFQEQYQQLMTAFETASSYVTAELRKMEVNLTQLPRAMDQTGAELYALMEKMDQQKQEN